MLGSAAIVQTKSSEAWRVLAEEREQLRLECRAMPMTREPLWGQATNEIAFGHYEAAGAIMLPLNDAMREMRSAWLRAPDKDLSKLALTLREQWLPALAALRAGAHARQLRDDAERADNSRFVNLLAYRDLVNAALYEARLLLSEGHDVGGVRCLLDALTLGADCVQDGALINQMVGVAMLAIVSIDCSDDMIHAMSPVALEQFAEGLALVDRRLPESMSTKREMLFSLDWMRLHQKEYEQQFAGTWQYGFSSRWMVCEAQSMAATSAARIEQMPAANWHERRRVLKAECQQLADSNNPAAGSLMPNYFAAEDNLRQSLAALRMLRVAVDLYRGIDAPALPDPTGDGMIQVSTENGGTLLRAVAFEQSSSRPNPNMQRMVCR
ncbi:MAG: hypothetical protein ACJA0V_002793 [Planctomycetota bacterium]|jgi:hypothetical protein